MMPLYDVISNAVNAIEEHRDCFSNYAIRIRLVASDDLTHQSGHGTLVVDDLDVIDDCVGFNDKNLASFHEVHNMWKVGLGNRHIGRSTFMKVVPSSRICSFFKHDGQAPLCELGLGIEDEVKDADVTPEVSGKCGTQTFLRAMELRAKWPRQPETVAARVISDLLIRFAARSCARMVLESLGQAPTEMHELFHSKVLAHIDEGFVDVRGYKFALQACRQRDGRSRHELTLCTERLEATTTKLRDPQLEPPETFLKDEQSPYTLIMLVTGEYLDNQANQGRAGVAFPLGSMRMNYHEFTDGKAISRRSRAATATLKSFP